MMPLIAPSLLAADLARLGEEAAAATAAGADWLHIDVMDGCFVPNFGFSPQQVAALRPLSPINFDVHLMVAQPLRHIAAFAAAGADRITIHSEAEDVGESLAAIRAAGKAAGLALKPATPIEAVLPYLGLIDQLLVMTVEPGFGGQAFDDSQLPKLRAARALLSGRAIRLVADGGITNETAKQAVAAGANVLAAGTAVFGSADYAMAVAGLRGTAA